MKKILCIALAAVMLLAAFPGTAFGDPIVQQRTKSGTCGAEGDGGSLTWTLDDEGTLRISGTGAMRDYHIRDPFQGGGPYFSDLDERRSSAPWDFCWDSNQVRIKAVVIENGVTHIGNYAFLNDTRLTTVTIADSVTEIGESAFSGCESLAELNYTGSESDWASVDVKQGNDVLNGARMTCNAEIPVPHEHTWGAWTKLDEEQHVRVCTGNAEHVETANHIWNAGEITTPATPEAEGEKTYTCTVCGATKTEKLPVVHVHAFVVVSDKFEHWFACSCGEIKDRASHSWDAGAVTKEATAEEDGEKTYTCTVCGAERTVKFAKFVKSGTCGKNLTWTLDYTGILTISGTGDMTDYGIRNPLSGGAYYSDGDERRPTSPWDFTWDKDLVRINTVIIEDGVTSIGNYAFLNNAALTTVTIPDSVTDVGDYAFSGCMALTDLTVGNGVTHIGRDAIPFSPWLDAQPDGLVYIGKVAYRYKGAMPEDTKIELRPDTREISDQAFSGCTGLAEITVPESVTSLGDAAFSGCTGLAEIAIPESVTSLGDAAFSGCTGLADITVPGSVTYIGKYAFSGCTGLTDLTVGSGVKRIGEYAFSGCTGLTRICLPEGVTTIDAGAFSDCTGLKKAFIPASVTAIGDNPFHNHNRDFMIFCVGTKEAQGSLFRMADAKQIAFDCLIEDGLILNREKTEIISVWDASAVSVTIPESVTQIADQALQECDKAEKVTIGSNAPYRYADLVNLKEVVLTDAVTEIPAQAFAGCSGLASVTIPDSLTKVGEAAFADCAALKVFSIAENSNAFSVADGVLYGKDGTELILYPVGREGASFTFPSGVVSVADGAFADSRNLKEICLPDRIVKMGAGCFARCEKLESVVCCSMDVLPERTFADCSSMAAVYIPRSLKQVGTDAFSGCSGLKEVYYAGTADEWAAVGVKQGNDALTGAHKNFNAKIPGAEEPAAHEHVWGAWTKLDDAQHVRVCTLDGSHVEKANHAWDAGKVTKEATAEADGVKTFACTVCGAEKTEVIPRTVADLQGGDADGNGRLEANDARTTLRAAVGLDAIEAGTPQFKAADADGNKKLEAADARLILRKVVGYVDKEFVA